MGGNVRSGRTAKRAPKIRIGTTAFVPRRSSGRTDGGGNTEDKPWLTRMLSGPRLLVTGLVTAMVAVLGTAAGNGLLTLTDEDVYIHAVEDDAGIEDYSFASEKQVDPARVKPWIQSRDLAASEEGLTKAAIQGVKVMFQAGKTAKIAIVDLRAVIVRKSPPVDGTFFFSTTQGTGNAQVGIDLDAVRPVARDIVKGRTPRLGRPYFAEHHVPLKDGEPAVFQVTAIPSRHTYDWQLEATLLIDGQQVVRAVMDDKTGQPRTFRVTGYAKHYRAAYTNAGEKWRRMSRADCAGRKFTCSNESSS